jgi:enhancer of mRNA-decapping protein 4
LHEYDAYLKQQRKLNEDNKDVLLNEMKQLNENMQSTLQRLNVQNQQSIQCSIDQQMRSSNVQLQETIITSVKAIVKEELNSAMRDQQQHLPERLITIMRQSGTITPVPTGAMNGVNAPHGATDDVQTRVMSYVQKKQYNQAFQASLCASDLNLLVNLCELVNPALLFEPKPCVLAQPVLLSLVQQLSQELGMHTEMKLKYIEEAIMNLDHTSPISREHIPTVISGLIQKIQQYIQLNPTDKLVKQMKMLLMASQSFFTR